MAVRSQRPSVSLWDRAARLSCALCRRLLLSGNVGNRLRCVLAVKHHSAAVVLSVMLGACGQTSRNPDGDAPSSFGGARVTPRPPVLPREAEAACEGYAAVASAYALEQAGTPRDSGGPNEDAKGGSAAALGPCGQCISQCSLQPSKPGSLAIALGMRVVRGSACSCASRALAKCASSHLTWFRGSLARRLQRWRRARGSLPHGHTQRFPERTRACYVRGFGSRYFRV